MEHGTFDPEKLSIFQIADWRCEMAILSRNENNSTELPWTRKCADKRYRN